MFTKPAWPSWATIVMLREKLRFYAEIKNFMGQNLRKAIMKRSELKSKANRTKQPKNISDYKMQRNFVVKLNKERNSVF